MAVLAEFQTIPLDRLHESPPPTAADIRALMARHRVRQYKLAAAIEVSPNVLSRMLNERRPLPADLAVKIRQVISAVFDYKAAPATRPEKSGSGEPKKKAAKR